MLQSGICSLCFALLVIIQFPGASQEKPAAKLLSARAARQDFDMLRKALEEAHGGLYRFSSRSGIDHLFNQYREKLSHDLSQQEFISILSGLLASLHDGHMRLQYDPETTRDLANAGLFPYTVSLEGKQLKILYNDSNTDTVIRAGMEILSINGNKISTLIRQLFSTIPGDGFIETGRARLLERNFARYYWLFKDPSGEFDLRLRTTGGKLIRKKVTGIKTNERMQNRIKNPANRMILTAMSRLEEPKENISLLYLPGKQTGLLRIRSFEGNDFNTRLDSIFIQLKRDKTPSLILDLRDNGGGVDEYGANLVAHFMTSPFRYFSRIHLRTISPSFTRYLPRTYSALQAGTVPDPAGGFLVAETLHPGVGRQEPFDSPFTGKLAILLNGGSFSTAADVTAILDNLGRAVFIGEESGGGYDGNTSGLEALLKMPNSKLNLNIHLYDYFNAVHHPHNGRGTLPDYPVERRVSDLLQSRDVALEKAVELLFKKINVNMLNA